MARSVVHHRVVVDLFADVPLPPVLRVAYVCGPSEVGLWLAQGLEQHYQRLKLHLIRDGAGAVGQLRKMDLEVVVLGHEPGHLEASRLLQALRLGGTEEPMVVLGRESEPEMAVVCLESGADEYICVQNATVEMLWWSIRRAVARAQLVRQNRRLVQQQQQARQQEQSQAAGRLDHYAQLTEQLLRQDIRPLSGDASATAAVGWGLGTLMPLPDSLQTFYLDLLRTFVVMGCGSLQQEIEQLAGALGRLQLPVSRVVQLHRQALETLLRGRGNRSCRHVLARADMLLIELLARLARWYRACYAQARRRPEQLWLPGLDPAECSHESGGTP